MCFILPVALILLSLVRQVLPGDRTDVQPQGGRRLPVLPGQFGGDCPQGELQKLETRIGMLSYPLAVIDVCARVL